MALARLLKRSTGEAIPIVANTKPTYRGGPLVPPYSGWLEPSTIRALLQRWSEEPLVARIVWWYYPVDDLKKDDQPSLAEQLQWWRTVDAWDDCPPVPPPVPPPVRQSPRLVFGPTANLPSVVAAQTVALVTDSAGPLLGPGGWNKTRALLRATGGTLHMRAMVVSQMTPAQHAAVVAGAKELKLDLSIEAGGPLCGIGSGNTTARHWFSGAGKAFVAAGGGALLRLWGLESVFSRTKRACPDQAVEDTVRELADYADVVARTLGHAVSLYLYDCIAHFTVGQWPANWPMPRNTTYDMDLGDVLTQLQFAMAQRGVTLAGYWADCPYSCSSEYAAKNGSKLNGYLRFATAVKLVKGMGLEIGKTFNAHPGTSEGFYNETLLDWERLAEVVPTPASGEFSLDLVAVETWYAYPAEAAPETEKYTTAFTARALFQQACGRCVYFVYRYISRESC